MLNIRIHGANLSEKSFNHSLARMTRGVCLINVRLGDKAIRKLKIVLVHAFARCHNMNAFVDCLKV